MFTPDGIDPDMLADLADDLLARHGEHVYVSTACLHDMHGRCGNGMRERAEPGPPHCKYCPALCVCACHRSVPAVTP